MGYVQEALQVSEGSWIVKDSSLEALIDGLKINLRELHDELKNCMDLNDVEILQHASGGRALQGVLVSRNLEDQLEIRENLLSVPQDAQLHTPSLSRDDKIQEFFSKSQEDQFIRLMDRLGYSETASAKAGFLDFHVQKSASYNTATEEGKMDTQQVYFSTIKYSFIPMSSFHFKGSQLKLSADALRDLQAFSGSQNDLQKQCEQFFHKYGSHVNKGLLHFSGIYWLKCYSYDFHESDMNELKRLQNQIVSASAGFSFDYFGASLKVGVSNLIEGDFSEALMSKTTVEVTKKGGPQTTSNIPLWKCGLVARNSTWNVIDCGSNTVPVWEIIQVQLLEFGEVSVSPCS